jgi:hypothetical protein
MANIITSKTRGRIRSQPKEYTKLITDMRAKTIEKHSVYSVSPTGGQAEDEIHKDMDGMGTAIKDQMEFTREKNRLLNKRKTEEREGIRQKVVKERLKLYEERDERRGLAAMAREKKSQQAKAAKKRR